MCFFLDYEKQILDYSSHPTPQLIYVLYVCSYSMLRWYHEGSLISADSSSYSVLDNGVTLVVERAETKQSGEYRCEVEGIGSLSGNLTVIGNQDLTLWILLSVSDIIYLLQNITSTQNTLIQKTFCNLKSCEWDHKPGLIAECSYVHNASQSYIEDDLSNLQITVNDFQPDSPYDM